MRVEAEEYHFLEPSPPSMMHLHLTELAATTSTSYTDNSTFFRAIAPPGLGSYLDECRVGGDLLQVLNMARENRGLD